MDDMQLALEEYKEAGSNMRHFSNMRMAELTLFSAITGALGTVLFSGKLSSFAQMVIQIVGVVALALLLFIEMKITFFWLEHRDRAIVLEKKLSFDQYTSSDIVVRNWPKRQENMSFLNYAIKLAIFFITRRMLSATFAVWSLHAIAIIVFLLGLFLPGWFLLPLEKAQELSGKKTEVAIMDNLPQNKDIQYLKVNAKRSSQKLTTLKRLSQRSSRQ